MGRDYHESHDHHRSEKVKPAISKAEYPIMTRKRSSSFHQSQIDEYLQANETTIKNAPTQVFLSFDEANFPEPIK
jgi:ATP-dependent RNA helicase DBP3